jgi:integrase
MYMEAARAGLVRTRFGRTKRSSTLAIDEGRISRHILPLIGEKIAKDLTRSDVQRIVDGIAAGRTAATIKTKARGVARVTGGAGTAARVAGLLGGIFTWAERRGLVSASNPVRALELRADEAKDRVLSNDELRRLGEAMRLAVETAPMAANALRLIALTGLRCGEAYGLRWREIDLDGSCLRLEASKTGRSTRPISKAAVEHLHSLPQLDREFVFPNRDGSGGVDLKKAIAAIFDAAGLVDARGHDLRRSFASTAANVALDEWAIDKLSAPVRSTSERKAALRAPSAV